MHNRIRIGNVGRLKGLRSTPEAHREVAGESYGNRPNNVKRGVIRKQRAAVFSELFPLSFETKSNERRSNAQMSSIETRLPTIAAARCRLRSVISSLESRSRSTWERLVFSIVAILLFEILFLFMASASCQATTSLIACACVSSRIPSCFIKSSMLDPVCFRLIAATPFLHLPANVHYKVHENKRLE